MRKHPVHRQSHYAGSGRFIPQQLHFGDSDRIRYHWTQPEAARAVAALRQDLTGVPPAHPVLRKYLSDDVVARADAISGRIANMAQALVLAQIQAALKPYFLAADQ